MIEFILKNPNIDTNTIYKLFFPSIRSCQHRLKKLVDVGLLSTNRENLLEQNMYFISKLNGEKYKKILTELSE